MSRARLQKTSARSLVYTAVGVLLLIQLYPLFWVLTSSFKDESELVSAPPYSLPHGFDWSNYARAFQEADLLRYMFNSAVVAVATIGLTIAFGAPAAYAIEKLMPRGGQRVLGYFLFGIMVPVFVSLLPMFQVFNEIGLRNSYWALIIPQVGFNLPICIYLYVGFMKYIPNELIDAARMDGATNFRIFRQIVFPLAANTTVTIVIFNFVFVWNEFVFANTFMTSNDMKTLPVGLNDYVGLYGKTDLGALYAAIVVSILPTIILYFILNRRVISGMAAGAVR